VVIPKLEVIGTFGLDNDSGSTDVGGTTTETATTTIGVGLYAAYQVAGSDAARLSAVGGFDLDYFRDKVGDTADTASDFLFAAGGRVEWFPTDDLSVYTQLG